MNPRMRIGIVGSLHGDELLGKDVIGILQKEDFPFLFIIGNTAAIARNVRFLESDLNRSFPGRPDGTLEERRAMEILEELQRCDVIIDIHSTLANTPPFVIAVEGSPEYLVDAAPLEKVVYVRSGLDPSGSLIAHKPGISLEYPHTATPEEVVAHIHGLVNNLTSGEIFPHQEYESIGVIKGEGVLENFTLVKYSTPNAEYEFFPVLSGAKSYKEVICVMCRRI